MACFGICLVMNSKNNVGGTQNKENDSFTICTICEHAYLTFGCNKKLYIHEIGARPPRIVFDLNYYMSGVSRFQQVRWYVSIW